MSSCAPIVRVLVLDDRGTVNRGLTLFFRAFPDLTFAGRVADIHAVLEQWNEYDPDVVVVDLKRPEADSAGVVRLIRRSHPDIRVLVLANSASRALIREVTEAGANAVLTKDISIDALAAAIRPELAAVSQPAEA